MKLNKIIISIFTFVGLALFLTRSVEASEGTFELGSTTGKNYRCFAASLLIEKFSILVVCKDLVYPSGSYVLWANPTDNSKPIRLGVLGYGRKSFSAGRSFSSLFVTLEANPNIKSPTGTRVMQGSINPITFLNQPTTPTPTPEKEDQEPDKPGEQKEDEKEDKGEDKKPTTREKLVTALKRAGIAALFALVALVGLIFVITRSRK
jgi:hypothetical protein